MRVKRCSKITEFHQGMAYELENFRSTLHGLGQHIHT